MNDTYTSVKPSFAIEPSPFLVLTHPLPIRSHLPSCGLGSRRLPRDVRVEEDIRGAVHPDPADMGAHDAIDYCTLNTWVNPMERWKGPPLEWVQDSCAAA